jgi:23S rRNA (cytidine2498-2'-O)-methyltransferase
MPTFDAQFVFMSCHAGAVGALKEEIARTDPAWRLAFSRPGFLTWKLPIDQRVDDQQLGARHWVLAHSHGLSLGRLSGTSLSELATQLWQHPGIAQMVDEHRPADVHVWQRETQRAGDRGVETGITPLARGVAEAVRAAAPEACAALREMPERQQAAPRNSRVLDVVLVEPNQWWFGYHRATTPAARWPGGTMPVALPDYAVSRAYAKMQEALAWSGLPIAAGEECVEIGCAPGGASQALLDHGLFVTGVDPADVDPAVLASPRFRHLRKRGQEVRRGEFQGVRWLAADMNIAPQDTLAEVEAIVTNPSVSIRGLVLTLKLADWGLARQLPEFAERIRGWGYRDVRMRQLVTGGQEICVVALRRRALRRLSRQRATQVVQPSDRQASAEATASETVQLRADAPHSTLEGPHF